MKKNKFYLKLAQNYSFFDALKSIKYSKFLLFLASILGFFVSNAQIYTLSTQPYATYVSNNGVTGNSCVTFAVQNTNSGPIVMKGFGYYFQTSSNGATIKLWYNPTSLGGPATVTTANNWSLIDSVMSLPVTVEGYTTVFNNNLNFIIPGNTTYRFAVQSSSNIRYSGTGSAIGSTPAPNTISTNGVSLFTGDYQIGGTVGYGGAFPTPPNQFRAFLGWVDWEFSGPCTSPPIAGTTTASSNIVCNGANVSLGLSGASSGTGQSYQWQSGPSATGPWTNIVGDTASTNTEVVTAPTYYQCIVTCSGQSSTSTPVFVGVNPNLPAGTYTIGPAGNYTSFGAAVAALSCGVAGPVIFNVLPNSGPYNEQITIPFIQNSSAVNTVTFNCNNNTLSFAPTATDRHILRLNGADYVTFNDLNITGTDATNGFGILLNNNSDFNTFVNVIVDLTATFANTGTGNAGIVVSGSNTSATTAGAGGTNNSFIGCTVKGGYYGMTITGSSAASPSTGNLINNCVFEDFYFYGLYITNTSNSQVIGNQIRRPNRSTVSSFYGISHLTGGSNNLFESNKIYNGYGGVTSANTSTSYGLYTTSDATIGSENKYYNNLIYDINNNGTVYGIYNAGADFAQYYHNTISLDHAASTAGITRGIFQTTAATGVEFRNNIVSVSRGGTGAKHCIYFGTATSAIVSNNNVFYLNAPAGTNSIGYFGANQNTLADWQLANGGVYDQNSIAADPQYVNASIGAFQPTNGAVNNIGAPLNVVTDILGNLRNATTPDPGAYEFSPAANDAGISALLNPVFGVAQPGIDTIKVALTNYGLSNLNSATVNGFITNGTTTVNFGPIPFSNPGLASAASASVTLGTFNFVSGSYTLKAWTSNPNSSTDANILNDSLITTICVGLSGTYTIGSTGNFSTISSAIAALSCGINGPVTFNILPNSPTFVEQITIPIINGASATNTITINGNDNTLSFAPTATDRHVLFINGADYLTINDLNIVGTDPVNGYGVLISNGSDNVTLDNIFVDISTTFGNTGTTNTAIAVTGSTTSATTTGNNATSLTIRDCRTVGGYYGITMSGISPLNTNNKIINTKVEDFYLYGIYHSTAIGDSIVGNEIFRPTRPNGSTFYGIFLTGVGASNVVSGNKVHDPFTQNLASTSSAYPIYVSGADAPVGSPTKIYNNLIYNIESNGLIYGFYNSSSDNIQYYHNTLSLDHQGATAGTTYGFYQITLATGIDIKNNIFSISRSGTGTKSIFYFSTATTTFTSNYNIFKFSPPAGTNNFGYYNAAQVPTFANWQAVNSNAFDQNSQLADPQFYNATTYYPTNYALDNLGTTLGVITDHDGTVRSATTPDIGAFEFGQPQNDVELTSLTTAFEPCFDVNDTLKATVTNTGFNTLNFATNNLTIAWAVSGTATLNGLSTVNTGTLAPSASMVVNLTGVLNLSAIGTYNVSADITSPWDDLSFNNEITRIIDVNPVIASASVDTTCYGSAVNLNVTGVSQGIQWQENTGSGFTNIVGANSANYQANPTASTSYRVSYCNGTRFSSSTSVYIIPVTPPTLTTAAPTVCVNQSTTLNVTSPLSVSWYNNPTGGAPLATGNSFTTPGLSTTTTYYASAATGSAGDSIAVNLASGTTTGVYHHMFMVSSITGMNVNGLGIKCNQAVGTLTSWDVYYRPDNYQSIPGANTSAAGWTLVSSVTNVPSAGANDYTIIGVGMGLNIPAGSTHSFYIAPATGVTHQYATNALGTVVQSNLDGSIIAGNRGSALFNVTTSGGMAVVKLLYSKGCESPRLPVTVTVNPNPTIALSADTTICQGEITTLDAGAGAASYLWSNGATTQSIQTGFAGTYGVTVTNNFNCTATDSIVVNVNALPNINLGADTTICSNTPLTLNAGAGFASYNWSNGAQIDSIVVNSTGNYSVTVEDANGCEATDIKSITVVAAPNPQLTDMDLCDGTSMTLNTGVPAAGNSFAWSNGATTPTIVVNTAGNYSVTVTANNGCTETANADITVIAVPALNLEGPAKVCAYNELILTAPAGFDNYTWFNGALGSVITIPANTFTAGATPQNIWVTGTVTATGCSRTDTLQIIFDECIGINELGNQNFIVFPNPSNGKFIIKGENISNAMVEVLDLTGKLITTSQIQSGTNQHPIDLTGASSGMYFLKITGNGFQNVERITIR